MAVATMEAVTDSTGKQPNTLTVKEEPLRQGFFPPNKHDQCFELSSVGQTQQCIADQGVEYGLSSQSVRKALGPQ
jgi:hypothetical protein